MPTKKMAKPSEAKVEPIEMTPEKKTVTKAKRSTTSKTAVPETGVPVIGGGSEMPVPTQNINGHGLPLLVGVSPTKIAERAREIWESEGCPDGRELDHWLRAERECAVRRV